jgi:deoxyguanosine kinase
MSEHTWIAVEGIIGAGKTTTASLLARRLGAKPTLEVFERHPLLEAYYKAPMQVGLATELVFMALRAHMGQELPTEGPVVSDFSPAKTHVYARLTVEAEDITLLEALDRRLWRGAAWPDIAVFLDVPPEVCLRRIHARGREFEQDIQQETLRTLRAGYLSRLDTLGVRVLSVPLSGQESPDAVAAVVADTVGCTNIDAEA